MAEGTSQGATPGQDTSFGTRLRRLREAAGLTQEALASLSGLSTTAVSVLERGLRRRPYPHTVRALADAMELSEEERAALLTAVPSRGAGPKVLPVAESNVPSPPNPLVGRERELQEIRNHLGNPEVRLLTLTGTGGVGKTRLAVAAALDTASSFVEGATFVALAPLGDAALVVPTVARVLGVRTEQDRALLDALHNHLRDKNLLLVLDNFEHVAEAAREIADLIESCPHLTVLATSRSPLKVRAEHEYPVPPLALPVSSRDPGTEGILESPSGRLFVERARAVSPSFSITESNAWAVATICWRLAGLPLALELAAANVRYLDPMSLLARLDRVLSTEWARDVPDRQRTMGATIRWSHDLLGEPGHALFRRLSVFYGGFSLEAAEAVGATEGTASEDVLGLLGELVGQSLVLAEPDGEGGTVRYGMLEPVRQYAAEKLEGSDEAEGTRRRHAGFFLALAERARPLLRGQAQVGWLRRLERENGNLRAAISWALDVGDHESAARLGWALWRFWLLRGHHREGRRWMERLLEQDPPSAVRARPTLAAAIMAYTQGDYEACESYARETLDLCRRFGDDLCGAYTHCMLGLVAMHRGDFEEATSRFEEAIPLFRRAGEESSVPLARVWLGNVLLARGDHGRAIPVFEEALAQARRGGDRVTTNIALYNLAQAALSRGDLAQAAGMLEESITLSEEIRDQANLAYCLEGLAVVAGARGQADHSARLFGAAEALLEEVGAPIYNYYMPDRPLRECTSAGVRSLLGRTTFERVRDEGRAMTFEQAVEYASKADGVPPA